MTAVFFKLLEMSASASVVAVAVILIKLLLNKVPRSVHCLLWTLVAVRLICPFAIESKLSLMPDRETSYESVIWKEGDFQFIDEVPYVPTVPGNQEIVPSVTVNDPALQVTTPPRELSFADIALLVWLAGALIMAAYGIGSFIRLSRKVSPSIKVGKDLYICDYINSPFVLGVLRPRIYIPSTLTEQEKGHVVAHETAHISRGDHWWKPIGFALLSLYWFNPVIWVAYILLCRDIELACDERVIREMNADGKKEYTSVLLSCSIPRRTISACPLAFGEVNVKRRIKNVLSYKKPTLIIILAAVLAVTVASVCLLTDPVSAADDVQKPAETEEGILDGGFDIGVDPEADEQDDFVPQKLTEVYYDIDGDGEDEYLVIDDPSAPNISFRCEAAEISIYKDGYKVYYNYFMPFKTICSYYFEITDEGELKVCRIASDGRCELSDLVVEDGRIKILAGETIEENPGRFETYYPAGHYTTGFFYIDTAVIVDIGWENAIIVAREDGTVKYGDMQYIVVKPLVEGLQMFDEWEAETFRFWVNGKNSTEEFQVGDVVKIVHSGSWGGSANPLGPVSSPLDISRVHPDYIPQ